MIMPAQLAEIGERVAAALPDIESQLCELRQIYPGLHFTYCQDDDVVAMKPCYQHPQFNLYLVDSRQHCLTLTDDPMIASGVVVAELFS
ncbi:MAG: hypothetical protein HQL49_06990 [Gammaproteobacteria bacterium]|nr:hypothetical protein [Gammaproteobacteria bacterium]